MSEFHKSTGGIDLSEMTALQRKLRFIRTPVLGRDLTILLWLQAAGFAGGLLGLSFVPAISAAGAILEILCCALCSAVLFRLDGEDPHFQSAGLCAMFAAISNLVILVLASPTLILGWKMIFPWPALALGIAQFSNLSRALSNVLCGLDTRLSDRWMTLRLWYMTCYIALGVSGILVILLQGFLLTAVFLAALLGAFAIPIAAFITLYRTAAQFRRMDLYA